MDTGAKYINNIIVTQWSHHRVLYVYKDLCFYTFYASTVHTNTYSVVESLSNTTGEPDSCTFIAALQFSVRRDL